MGNSFLRVLLFLTSGLVCAAQGQEDNQPASLQLASASPAGTATVSPDSWQAVRDKQPAGLHLRLTLPKTRFYLGELIPARLDFSNDSKEPFHLWMGTYDRSGRIEDIAFRAHDEDGSPVGDPLAWYFDSGAHMGGGLGNFQNLGDWDITLPANQWLSFEKPGKYKLYARSARVTLGDKDARDETQIAAVELVSDPVTIIIVPLSAGEEKAIIDHAKEVLSGPSKGGRDEAALDAITRLRYLQTPSAWDALLQLIDSRYGNEAILGLYARPDCWATADKILAAVREKRLGLSNNLLQVYTRLKGGDSPFLDRKLGDILWSPLILGPKNGGSVTIASPQSSRRPSDAELREDLYAAARSGITKDGTGQVFFANLLTLFRNDPREPEIRAIVIKRQLDLPQKQIDEALNEKELMVDRDFMPLLRELVKPEKHNPYALAALAGLAPEEARPIVIEDVKRSHPIYMPSDLQVSPAMDLFALKALPDREIPALDPVLRERLALQHDLESMEATMLLIERYATKALLPDVVRIYQMHEGGWACVLQGAMLRYWIRCDRAAGVEALGRALGKNGQQDTGCFHTVLNDVLRTAWVDEALPLVLAAMENKDLQVIRSAAPLLEGHAGPEAIDRMIAAIEEVAARPLPQKASDRDELLYVQRALTSLLIDSKRWALTRPQLERLQKAGLDKNLKARIESMLAKMEK